MEIDRRELKRQARERMVLTDPKFWMVALAYIAMTTGVSWLISFLPIPHTQTSLLFFQLLLSLYTTVVQFGLCLWALWTYRQLDPDVSSLTQGFSVAGRVILMQLGIYVRLVGWYFITATILAIPVLTLLFTGAGSGVGMLSLTAFAAGLFAVIIIISLRYALAPYLLADRPDDGPTAPIRRSAALMRGRKWQLFKLELSFLGWDLINFLLSAVVILFFLSQAGLLTPEAFAAEGWRDQCLSVIYSTRVVILSTLVTVPVSLWLLPYRSVARAAFYDNRMLATIREDPLPEMPPL